MTELPTLTDRFIELAQAPQLGWAMAGVRAPETVYEHSHEMALLAVYLGQKFYPGVNAQYCAEMCMVHGLTELLADPEAGHRTSEWKLGAIKKLQQETSPTPALMAAVGLFQEYVANETPAARLANQLDSLQMSCQLVRYEREYSGLNAAPFWDYAQTQLEDPHLLAYLRLNRQHRPADVEDRPQVSFRAINPDQVRQETLQRVRKSLPNIWRERQQAVSRPPYAGA